jgi:hypothetical protein
MKNRIYQPLRVKTVLVRPFTRIRNGQFEFVKPYLRSRATRNPFKF